MKNTLILLSVLLVFGAAYFLFVYNRDGSTSLNTNESAFAITDTSVVGKVVLVRLNKGKELGRYEIRRGPGGWTDANEFPVFQPRVNTFLGTAAQLYVRDPIQDQAQQSALTILKGTHTEVTYFDLTGKQLKKYFVGPPNSPQTANIMLLEGAEQAFLVSKPGFTGYISVYFTTDPYSWREKLLFNVKGEQLTEVQAAYKGEGSFAIRRSSKDGEWTLEGAGTVDTKIIGKYLEGFQGKTYAESFGEEHYAGLQDSLKASEPDVRFSYKTSDGQARTMVLYAQSNNPNRYFGWMEDNKIFYTIQRSVIDKFLVLRAYFEQKAA